MGDFDHIPWFCLEVVHVHVPSERGPFREGWRRLCPRKITPWARLRWSCASRVVSGALVARASADPSQNVLSRTVEEVKMVACRGPVRVIPSSAMRVRAVSLPLPCIPLMLARWRDSVEALSLVRWVGFRWPLTLHFGGTVP